MALDPKALELFHEAFKSVTNVFCSRQVRADVVSYSAGAMRLSEGHNSCHRGHAELFGLRKPLGFGHGALGQAAIQRSADQCGSAEKKSRSPLRSWSMGRASTPTREALENNQLNTLRLLRDIYDRNINIS